MNPLTYNFMPGIWNTDYARVTFTPLRYKHDNTLGNDRRTKIAVFERYRSPIRHFSAKWQCSPVVYERRRFAAYCAHISQAAARFAFVQHMAANQARATITELGLRLCLPHGCFIRRCLPRANIAKSSVKIRTTWVLSLGPTRQTFFTAQQFLPYFGCLKKKTRVAKGQHSVY